MAKETKTESSSQSQQNTSAFDPMGAFSKLSSEHVARVTAFWDELATWESAAYERVQATAKKSTDQVSDYMGDTMAYANQLASEWRRMTLDATRRTVDLLRNQG